MTKREPDSVLSRLFKILIFIAIIGTGLMAALYYKLDTWGQTAVTVPSEAIVEVPKGTGLTTVATKLLAEDVIDDALFFQIWVRVNRLFPRFQAGLYRFEGNVAPKDIAAKMTSGDIFVPIVIQYTIPEGFTLKQIFDRLLAHKITPRSELEKLARDSEFLSQLNIPAKSLEGYIYPATYSYDKHVTPREALMHMVQTFWSKMPNNYENAVKAKGLTLHQAVTFASLIELETKHDDEKSLISEVIWARLKDKVPLGIDASIIYGIADYDGDLRWKHLGDASNPYNSRIHRGLPPGPIGAPSASSMAAVLTPTQTGAYYYVLKPDSDRHHFSKTLQEHNRHVKKLVEAHRRNKGR